MRTRYNIEDQRPTDPPTDLAFCKISNGHISATCHPIHFMFGSRVGFSRSADRMDLLPVGPNPRWRLESMPKIYTADSMCLSSFFSRNYFPKSHDVSQLNRREIRI